MDKNAGKLIPLQLIFSNIFMRIISRYFSSYHKSGGIKELLALALPMIISTAADGVMTFTDRLFLARVDSNQMNAALGGGITLMVFQFFFIGLIGYSTALVAQYMGANQKNNSSKTTFQALVLAVFSWPIIVLALPLANIIFNTAQIPEQQLGYQLQYIQILAYGSVFGMLRHTLSCYFSGIGKTRIVMIATLVAMLVNVILDYIFIFGKFGISPMGIQGAALATILGSFSATIVLLFAYFSKSNVLEFFILQSFRWNTVIMKKLLKYGSPAGLEMFLNLFAFSMMITLFQSQGEVISTAVTIMFNWDFVSFIPLLGIEVAVTSLVGRYMGAGKPHYAHRAAISGIKIGIFYSFIILILFVFVPEWLVRVFSPDKNVEFFEQSVPIAVSMIQIASLYVLAEAFIVAIIGALRGAGDTFFTMLASVSMHWLFVPVLYVALNVFNLSVTWSWFLLVVFFLVFCGILYLRFIGGKWKQIKIINHSS